MPPPDPPDSSPPPASQPAGTQPAPDDSAPSTDAINQAIAAVKAAFPPDSSPLADLRLDSSDNATISLVAVLSDRHEGWSPVDLDPMLEAIAEQFAAQSITQGLTISYAWLSGTDPDSGPSSGDVGSSSSQPPPESAP
jgi:hypothetical protein